MLRGNSGCSKLNYDLVFNLHLPDIEPKCACGAKHETAKHFFLICPNYSLLRNKLKTNMERLCDFTLNNILNGCSSLTNKENETILDFVHEYIIESNRFNQCNFTSFMPQLCLHLYQRTLHTSKTHLNTLWFCKLLGKIKYV